MKIEGKINATKLHKEISRDAFRDMPKCKRVEDKRRKPPKHRKQGDE